MRRTLSIAAWAAACCPAIAQDMIGVEWSGNSYAVSSATGAGVLLGPSGFSSLNAMARVRDVYYAARAGGDLISIDPATGAGAVAVTTVPVLNSIRGLASLPGASPLLYAIQDGGSTAVDDNLYTIDPTTGATNLIGTTTGFRGLQGLAFDPAGNLYGFDITAGLVTIDPATALTTDVNTAVGGTGIQCLAFSQTGVLYGGQTNLYTIDTTTGAQALVGPGAYSDLRGLDFRRGPALGNWKINEVFTGLVDYVEIINCDTVPLVPDGISLWSYETRGNSTPCAPAAPPLGLNLHYTVPPGSAPVAPGTGFVIREGAVAPACGFATGANIFWFEASDVICWINADAWSPRSNQLDMVCFGDINQYDQVNNTFDGGGQWNGGPVCRANLGCDSIYRPAGPALVPVDTDRSNDWRFAPGAESTECGPNPPLLPNPLTFGRGYLGGPGNCAPVANGNLSTWRPTLTIDDGALFNPGPGGATFNLSLQTGLPGAPPILSAIAFNFVGVPGGAPIPVPGCGGALLYLPPGSPSFVVLGGPGGPYNAGVVWPVATPGGFPGLQIWFQAIVLAPAGVAACPFGTTNGFRVTLL